MRRVLRPRFGVNRGLGGRRHPPFLSVEIAFSTLNRPVPVLVRFVPVLVRRPVNTCPGKYWYGKAVCLGNSGLRARCTNSLVVSYSFTTRPTWVRVLAWSFLKNPQKSSKSSKFAMLGERDAKTCIFRTEIGTTVPISVRSLLYLVLHRCSIKVSPTVLVT